MAYDIRITFPPLIPIVVSLGKGLCLLFKVNGHWVSLITPISHRALLMRGHPRLNFDSMSAGSANTNILIMSLLEGLD